MKVIYNNKEIINSTDDYNGLLNRPMINSQTLEGIITLDDIDAYTKDQIDELIGNSRSIEIVTVLPTNLVANTLYYVGPDANDFYTVYLVDEVRNVIQIGTSQFGEYYGGAGINIDNDNYIHVKIDNNTIIVDSENNLHARLDISTVPDFTGATSTVAGNKGLVPTPPIGSQDSILRADKTWQKVSVSASSDLVNQVFPVGSFYYTWNDTNPGTFFPGTTWSKIGVNRVLWTDASSGGSVNSGTGFVPNIKSTIPVAVTATSGSSMGAEGCFTVEDTNRYVYISPSSSSYVMGYRGTWNISASRNTTIYGNSTRVQPPAISICGWRRTA